jgi:hypothetical protein
MPRDVYAPPTDGALCPACSALVATLPLDPAGEALLWRCGACPAKWVEMRTPAGVARFWEAVEQPA